MEASRGHARVLDEELYRIQQTNEKLRRELEREVVPCSVACERLVAYCNAHAEPLLIQPPVDNSRCCIIA